MKLLNFLSALIISCVLFLSACGKEETTPTSTAVVPKENFTTYTGEYAYTGGTALPVVDTKAKATVKDLGNDKLEITFTPAGAPTLTATMKKSNNTYVNVDFSTQLGITMDGTQLTIGVNSSNPAYQLAFVGSR